MDLAGKKQTKIVVRALNDWNKPRFVEQDEFCKASLKVLATSKEKLGKVIFLAESAKRDMEAIDKAATNEELFNAQNRLRELCAAVVEESVSIMNYEGTLFDLK